jgi:hypothetical protein
MLTDELGVPWGDRFSASTAKTIEARGLWTSGQFELALEPAR